MNDNWDRDWQALLDREDFDRGYPRDDDRMLPSPKASQHFGCQYFSRPDIPASETGRCHTVRMSGTAFCQRHFDAYWRVRAQALPDAT